MKEKPDYLISGVWKDENDVITHCKLHDTYDKKKVKRASIKEVIELLDNYKLIYTVVHNNADDKWEGERVYAKQRNGREYLTTMKNNVETDNLENLKQFKS